MLPTLNPGQDVLVWCWFNKYKVGDIVVIRHSGRAMVKRIQKTDGRRVFVTGDNKKMSTDSRSFGWIEKKNLVGKVILIF